MPKFVSPLPGPVLNRLDPTGLEVHMSHCAAAKSTLHQVNAGLEDMDAFVLPRFLSLLLVILALGGSLLWLGS